ncbi:MAG: polymorphic toxin-type HINT domain-containing protein, partial [Proteobacteria bacterium]|nr:polymorphic toxin-type HINT domain-containing protein [Pseudomonadota bacterium]
GGRLMRINIDQLSSQFLREQQTVQFDGLAPYGFQDMAINNSSYLALTAPTGKDIITNSGFLPGQGNVYILDLGKIDLDGKIDNAAVVSIKGNNFPQERGRVPTFISSGKNEGEFLLSSAKDYNNGLIGIKVGMDERGNLDKTIKTFTTSLTPKDSNPNWLNAKFQQNIQRSQGNVVVEYGGKQYALVADYNFDFNDVHYVDYENYGAGKQIGGKIGIVEDPFGSAIYLGATTPIVGGAVDHLTLAADGKLYADVFMYNDVANNGSMHNSLFVWNASTLIQSALDSRKDNQKTTTPIDRFAAIQGMAGQRTPAIPQRYDDRGDGRNFYWTYGIGAYSVPGRFAKLDEIKITYPPSIASGGENNIYKDMLGISAKQVAQQKEDGTYSAFENLAKTVFYNGWNFFTVGVLEKQAERYNQLSEGKISSTSYATASLIDGIASVASIAVGGRIASGLASRFGTGMWGAVAGSAAEGALATILMKEGEVLSYEITNPGKLDSTYWKNSVTELTVATALSAGMPLLGGIMSGKMRGNYKVMWNSPNELNPTQFKVVQPTPSNKSSTLFGSMADSTGGSVLNHAGGVLQTPSKALIQIPKTASLTVEEALAWQRGFAPDLITLLNKDASILEQSVQAVKIKNDLMISARNAMDDANAAAQLGITTPPRTFNEMLRARSNEFGGDKLYKQVISDAQAEMLTMRKASNPIGCFVAGTLVHTKDGLKPIESIKIGDLVLSQPEETGEKTYKRVIRTFQFENKEVNLLYWTTKDVYDEAVKFGVTIDPSKMHSFVVTENHPFWVNGLGWTRADHLEYKNEFELCDGRVGVFSRIDPIYRTLTNGVGWVPVAARDPEKGRLLDLRNGQIKTEKNPYSTV